MGIYAFSLRDSGTLESFMDAKYDELVTVLLMLKKELAAHDNVVDTFIRVCEKATPEALLQLQLYPTVELTARALKQPLP